MQVTELFKLQKHSVYLVRTEVINYYICIPENSYQKTNISIEIKTKMGNYNMDENDETWVLENVKNTYNYVDDYNITLVLPIMNESMQSILEKMDEEKFVLVDQVLAYIINSSFNFKLLFISINRSKLSSKLFFKSIDTLSNFKILSISNSSFIVNDRL